MYSAAMSPPRCPVPRPSSKSLARNFTCARMFSLVISGRAGGGAAAFPCADARSVILKTHTSASAAARQITAYFFMESPQRKKELFLGAIFQQIFQLAHELLHVLAVLESQGHRGKPDVGHLFLLLQALHDHLADFRRSTFPLRGLVHHAFNFIDDLFQLGRGYRPLLAGLQQSLQNLLPLEAFAAAVLLDYP